MRTYLLMFFLLTTVLFTAASCNSTVTVANKGDAEVVTIGNNLMAKQNIKKVTVTTPRCSIVVEGIVNDSEAVPKSYTFWKGIPAVLNAAPDAVESIFTLY